VQLVNISGKKEKEFLKAKIDEIESNIKKKKYQRLV